MDENNVPGEYPLLLKKDNWKPTKNLKDWKTVLSKTATNTLTKDQRIRLTEKQAQ